MAIAISCNQVNERNGAVKSSDELVTSASVSQDEEELPKISFSTDTHEFGKLVQGEKVSYAFKFTNSGKSDLRIIKVTSSCGCTVTSYPEKPIKPGESSKIDVKFDSQNRRGYQNKTITVLSNTHPNATTLRISAQVMLPGEINN
jgi:hypothetical protein